MELVDTTKEPDSIPQLRLNSLENARKSFTRIVREYNAGRLPEQRARTLGYLFNVLLTYFKTERDDDLLKRLEALEEYVKENQR